MKDNFLLKTNQGKVFKELSDEDAGKLIKGIYDYATTGDSKLDGYLKIIFLPIKDEIDKNEENYQKRCEINKVNGSKGGAPKGNQNAKKKGNNQKQPKTTKNNMNNHNHYHIHNQIIEYLNNKLKSNYRSNSKNTIEKINARLNEGYSLDDFIVVINKKYDEWKETEYERYLCPETLFGTKFEKYLNQKISNGKKVNKTDWIDRTVESVQASDDEINQLTERLNRK